MKKVKIYVPGLLSLLFLFPLLMHKLSNSRIFDKEHVMEVTWHNPEIENRYARKFPPSKDYIDINLTGDTLTDKVKIEYAKVLLDEMVTLFDTTRGVHFVFTDTAKYESFVEILNFCSQQDALAYAPHGSDFWIFNRFKSQEQKEYMRFGHCTFRDPLNVPEVKHNFAWAIAYGVDYRFWPVGLLFILLIIVNFKRRLEAKR
jgi:hypothetical protein